MDVYSSMKILDDLDFKSWMDWKLDIQLVLGLMDLDFALLHDKPKNPTVSASLEDIAKYEKWGRCNRLSLMMMRKKMHDGLFALVPETNRSDAKQFFAALEEIFLKLEKTKQFELLTEFRNIKYDGEGGVGNHLLRMSSFAFRLGATGYFPSDVYAFSILNSLPPEYIDIKFKHECREEGFNLNELICSCEQREHILHQQNMDSPGFGERESTENDLPEERPNKRRDYQCWNCGRTGHLRKDCWQITTM